MLSVVTVVHKVPTAKLKLDCHLLPTLSGWIDQPFGDAIGERGMDGFDLEAKPLADDAEKKDNTHFIYRRAVQVREVHQCFAEIRYQRIVRETPLHGPLDVTSRDLLAFCRFYRLLPRLQSLILG